jgi:hypothetical protein
MDLYFKARSLSDFLRCTARIHDGERDFGCGFVFEIAFMPGERQFLIRFSIHRNGIS